MKSALIVFYVLQDLLPILVSSSDDTLLRDDVIRSVLFMHLHKFAGGHRDLQVVHWTEHMGSGSEVLN